MSMIWIWLMYLISQKKIAGLSIFSSFFSKYLWVQPLKNKTAKNVVNALKKIQSNDRKCNKIRSDKGKEFNNNIMEYFLKHEGVQYITTQISETKANYAERVIKTLKNIMYRYFSEKRNHRYLDVLQDIVKSYNSTPHRTLNYIASKNVNKNNEADIWGFMYLKPKKITSTKVRRYQFKVGDLVRISYITIIFFTVHMMNTLQGKYLKLVDDFECKLYLFIKL